MANNLTNIVRWIAGASLAIAALWVGFLSYMSRSYAEKWSGQLDTLQQSTSMVSIYVVHYWPLFLLFSVASMIAAVYLVVKVNALIVFSLSIGVSALVAAFIINVMVVSTGFELSSLIGE